MTVPTPYTNIKACSRASRPCWDRCTVCDALDANGDAIVLFSTKLSGTPAKSITSKMILVQPLLTNLMDQQRCNSRNGRVRGAQVEDQVEDQVDCTSPLGQENRNSLGSLGVPSHI
jgi:hypothetical protein